MSRLRHGTVDPRAATEAIPTFETTGSSVIADARVSQRIRQERRRQRAKRERQIMIACILGALVALGVLTAVIVHLRSASG